MEIGMNNWKTRVVHVRLETHVAWWTGTDL